jgi:hypothetical protein
MATCNCWVSKASAETQFCVRYGAHSVTCPKHRPSGDPVDRMHDEELRRLGEAGKVK